MQPRHRPCRPRWSLLGAVLLAVLWCGRARAADIQIYAPRTLSMPVVLVSGEFRQADGEKFAGVVAKLDRALVVFNSPGGSLVAGLQIGQIIRLRRFLTFVPEEGAYCASACAFAWLAGAPRIMQPHSRIGFHAAYVETAGRKQETGVGNALAGAYLNNLGLSTDAIIYVEMAHPNEITWLTVEDARRLRIDVKVVPSDAGRPAERPSPRPDTIDPGQIAPGQPRVAGVRPETTRRTDQQPAPPSIVVPELAAPQEDEPSPTLVGSLEQRARRFTRDYFAHWSEESSQALAFFRTSYAPQVSFYGRQAERSDLLDGKKRYTEQWPVRIYATRADSLRVFCNDESSTCTVSGLVDWDCRSPARNARTSGTANFSLTLTLGNGRNLIVGENGSVVARNAE